MEATAPTKEWLIKFDGGRYVPPETDQKRKQAAGRLVCPFEMLYDQNKIDDLEYAAGLKLARHFVKSQLPTCTTANYAQPLDPTTDNSDDGDEATWTPAERAIYHGQKLREARARLSDERGWVACTGLLSETRTLEGIGRDWFGCKSKQQAYIAGVALVRVSLSRLANVWGLLDRPPDTA